MKFERCIKVQIVITAFCTNGFYTRKEANEKF